VVLDSNNPSSSSNGKLVSTCSHGRTGNGSSATGVLLNGDSSGDAPVEYEQSRTTCNRAEKCSEGQPSTTAAPEIAPDVAQAVAPAAVLKAATAAAAEAAPAQQHADVQATSTKPLKQKGWFGLW
jgi:hypothetical protein